MDVTEVARALYRLVKEKDLNCRVYKTTRGYHFVFMNSEYIRKNTVKAINALGVEFDCRYGKNAYILLKHDGLMRQIVRDFDGSRPVDALPKFLMAVKGAKTLFGMGEGSGRNSGLFGHIIPLVRSGFHMSEARDILRLINEYVFAESLPEEEMAKILRDEAFVKIADSSCSAADDFGSAFVPLISVMREQRRYLPANTRIKPDSQPRMAGLSGTGVCGRHPISKRSNCRLN